MSKRKDYTGLVNDYGVECIGEAEPVKDNAGKNHRILLLKCGRCGKEWTARVESFEKLKSCGCAIIEYRQQKMRKIRNDLSGKRFGRLTVVARAANKGSRTAWCCICDCGNQCVVASNDLISGHTKSCGCLFQEMMDSRNKERKGLNDYDLESYEYGVGITSNGTVFKFDKEDFDVIKNRRWNTNAMNYITAHDEDSKNRKTLFMHREILRKTGEDWTTTQVDHRNGDPTDNRKSNLRVVTPSKNGMNRGLQKNNSSGAAGVNFRAIDQKWVARINSESNKRIIVGAFDSFEAAVFARREAEEKYYGEYSYRNSRKLKGEADG